ncbi:hypothetical protein Tco_1147274, partial [Tanacetum coccineum]
VMGKPLSPDRVFHFPMDEPHPAYDFFAPALLPEYAGNPNNNNGWLAADDYLLGELKAMVDEQMVVPAVDEIAEQMDVHAVEEVAKPVVEAEEEQVIAPVADVVEGQMDVPMIDKEEDFAVLFGDDDFEDDASDRFGEEEVWEVNEDWLMAPTTPPPVLAVPPPSIYEVGGPSIAVAEGPSFPQVAPSVLVPPCIIEDLSTRLDNLEYGHEQLDDHEFPAEEQPLPPIDSPTTESPRYVIVSDPEEDPEEYEDDETEDGPVDYPMDGEDDKDDDDSDSSGDDADGEDDDEEEEEHLTPADSTTVIPIDEPVFPPEGTEPVIPPSSTDI